MFEYLPVALFGGVVSYWFSLPPFWIPNQTAAAHGTSADYTSVGGMYMYTREREREERDECKCVGVCYDV